MYVPLSRSTVTQNYTHIFSIVPAVPCTGRNIKCIVVYAQYILPYQCGHIEKWKYRIVVYYV